MRATGATPGSFACSSTQAQACEGVTPLAHARREGFDELAAILERAGGRA